MSSSGQAGDSILRGPCEPHSQVHSPGVTGPPAGSPHFLAELSKAERLFQKCWGGGLHTPPCPCVQAQGGPTPTPPPGRHGPLRRRLPLGAGLPPLLGCSVLTAEVAHAVPLRFCLRPHACPWNSPEHLRASPRPASRPPFLSESDLATTLKVPSNSCSITHAVHPRAFNLISRGPSTCPAPGAGLRSRDLSAPYPAPHPHTQNGFPVARR